MLATLSETTLSYKNTTAFFTKHTRWQHCQIIKKCCLCANKQTRTHAQQSISVFVIFSTLVYLLISMLGDCVYLHLLLFLEHFFALHSPLSFLFKNAVVHLIISLCHGRQYGIIVSAPAPTPASQFCHLFHRMAI